MAALLLSFPVSSNDVLKDSGGAGQPTVRRRADIRSTVELMPGGLAPDTPGIFEQGDLQALGFAGDELAPFLS